MSLQRISQFIQDSLLSGVELKHFVERSVAFSPDSLHVIAGVLILFVAALLLRKPVSSWWPWLVVLLLVCVNEGADLSADRWPHSGMQYGETVKDLLLTMALPTMLLFAARFLPGIFEQRLRR